MTESSKHILLIQIIKEYVLNNINIEKAFLKCDLLGECKTEKVLNGYTPDVHYEYNGQVIIGEAKTINDINRTHSLLQYKSFLEYCNNYNDSIFIISVPWTETVFIKNILRKIKNDNKYNNVKIIIINDVKKVCEI